MLAHGGHPSAGEAFDELRGKGAHRVRVVMECAVPDHGAGAVVEIEHGREAEIQPVRAQFRGDHRPRRARRAPRRLPVAVPEHAQPAHGRDGGETKGEALHPAPLVVHADRQFRLAQPRDLVGERGQLLGILVVVRKEDHAAGRRMAQAPAVILGQCWPDGVEHHRTQRNLQSSHSRMTVAEAISRSSLSERWLFRIFFFRRRFFSS